MQQHYANYGDEEDDNEDGIGFFDSMGGIQQNFKRLHRNDPNTTWMTTPILGNPNMFVFLGQSLVGNTHCLDLLMDNLVLNEAAAQSLAHGLAQSNLQRFTIRNSIQERPTEETSDDGVGRIRQIFFRGIQASPTLQELTIDSVQVDQLTFFGDAITRPSASSTLPPLRKLCLNRLILTKTKPTKQFAKALKAATLNCLHIREGLQERPGQSGRLIDIVCEGIQSNPTLAELRIESSPIEQLGHWRQVLMNAMPALQTFTLSEFHDPRGANQYAQLVVETLQNRRLTGLQLWDGIFGPAAVSRLAHTIQQGHNSLTTLKLHSIHMDDQSLAMILDHWGPSPIQTLSLHYNDIGPDSVPRLVRFVREHPSLQTLDLSSNPFGFDGIRAMALELPNFPSQLQQLNLGDCADYREFGNDPAGIQQARELDAAGRRAGLALLQGIQHNVYLPKLLLENNEFPDDILHDIGFYLSLNGSGRYLLSTTMDHGLASTVWCHIFAKSARQYPTYEASILFYFLCEQPALVPPCDGGRTREERDENMRERDQSNPSSSSRSSGCSIM
jgi:hypothetical protein